MERGYTTQADRIFARFGGPVGLIQALARAGHARAPSSVYRWNMPRAKRGTDGMIPTRALGDVMIAARLEGVVLTENDLYPWRLDRK